MSLDAYTDQNGHRLPPALIKFKEIPIQFTSADEAITYTMISDSVLESTTIISSGNAIMNIIMKSSLNKLWSMINSQ